MAFISIYWSVNFSEKSSLKRYIKIKYEVINLRWEICQLTTTRKNKITTHIESKHYKNKIKCSECSVEFDSRVDPLCFKLQKSTSNLNLNFIFQTSTFKLQLQTSTFNFKIKFHLQTSSLHFNFKHQFQTSTSNFICKYQFPSSTSNYKFRPQLQTSTLRSLFHFKLHLQIATSIPVFNFKQQIYTLTLSLTLHQPSHSNCNVKLYINPQLQAASSNSA